MSRYTIRKAPGERDPFGDYEYEIFLGDEKVAQFSHDFRGEEPTIRTADDWRFCVALKGGGGEPLEVTEEGERALDEMMRRSGDG